MASESGPTRSKAYLQLPGVDTFRFTVPSNLTRTLDHLMDCDQLGAGAEKELPTFSDEYVPFNKDRKLVIRKLSDLVRLQEEPKRNHELPLVSVMLG